MTNLAFVDTETGGLVAGVHPLIEVAIILEPEDELIHFSLQFKPSECTPQALQTNKALERIDELNEIQESVFDAVGILKDTLDGRVFVGNNPAFDARFLEVFMARGGVKPTWHYHLVDIKALVAGRARLLPPWSTKEIAEYAKISLPEAAHTAVADCEWNRDVFNSLRLLPKEAAQ
jgi:DNA polymerase III alpha subunit (gram-positive type)